VDRRKPHRAAIEQIGQILSIAELGGGLPQFRAAQKSVEVEGQEAGTKTGKSQKF
jgi:hypothetical protein